MLDGDPICSGGDHCREMTGTMIRKMIWTGLCVVDNPYEGIAEAYPNDGAAAAYSSDGTAAAYPSDGTVATYLNDEAAAEAYP